MNFLNGDEVLDGIKRGAERFGTSRAVKAIKKLGERLNGFAPEKQEPYGVGMGGANTEQESQGEVLPPSQAMENADHRRLEFKKEDAAKVGMADMEKRGFEVYGPVEKDEKGMWFFYYSGTASKENASDGLCDKCAKSGSVKSVNIRFDGDSSDTRTSLCPACVTEAKDLGLLKNDDGVAERENEYTKRAWVRDANAPEGKPGKGRISCPCGNAPLSEYGDDQDVHCSCGRVYGSRGEVKKDLENDGAGGGGGAGGSGGAGAGAGSGAAAGAGAASGGNVSSSGLGYESAQKTTTDQPGKKKPWENATEDRSELEAIYREHAPNMTDAQKKELERRIDEAVKKLGFDKKKKENADSKTCKACEKVPALEGKHFCDECSKKMSLDDKLKVLKQGPYKNAAESEMLSKCLACGFESPEKWNGQCGSCGVKNEKDVAGKEALKNSPSRIPFRKTPYASVEEMARAVLGEDYKKLDRDAKQYIDKTFQEYSSRENADTFNVHCPKCDELTKHTGDEGRGASGERKCEQCGTTYKWNPAGSGKWEAKNADESCEVCGKTGAAAKACQFEKGCSCWRGVPCGKKKENAHEEIGKGYVDQKKKQAYEAALASGMDETAARKYAENIAKEWEAKNAAHTDKDYWDSTAPATRYHKLHDWGYPEEKAEKEAAMSWDQLPAFTKDLLSKSYKENSLKNAGEKCPACGSESQYTWAKGGKECNECGHFEAGPNGIHRENADHPGTWSQAFDVYVGGKKTDTVFFTSNHTPEEVKRSLVQHDGYDEGIEVKKGPERRNAGHLGPDTWLAASLNEKANWLESAGQDINLATKTWVDLSEDVHVALQDRMDKPVSQNNAGALAAGAKHGAPSVESVDSDLGETAPKMENSASTCECGHLFREHNDAGTCNFCDGEKCPYYRERQNAGHLGPESWMAASPDERHAWLQAAGQEVGLADKGWEKLSLDTQRALQDELDMPASRNNAKISFGEARDAFNTHHKSCSQCSKVMADDRPEADKLCAEGQKLLYADIDNSRNNAKAGPCECNHTYEQHGPETQGYLPCRKCGCFSFHKDPLKNAYEMAKCAECGHSDGSHDGLHGKCFEEARPGDTKAVAHPSDGFKRCSCQKFVRKYENASSQSQSGPQGDQVRCSYCDALMAPDKARKTASGKPICHDCAFAGEKKNSKKCPVCQGRGYAGNGSRCEECGGSGNENSKENSDARKFDGKKLAEPRPCPGCQKDTVLVDTALGLCKECFDKDQSPKMENAEGGKCPMCDGTGDDGQGGACRECYGDGKERQPSKKQNADPEGDLEEIERHVEGIEHEAEELKEESMENAPAGKVGDACQLCGDFKLKQSPGGIACPSCESEQWPAGEAVKLKERANAVDLFEKRNAGVNRGTDKYGAKK